VGASAGAAAASASSMAFKMALLVKVEPAMTSGGRGGGQRVVDGL